MGHDQPHKAQKPRKADRRARQRRRQSQQNHPHRPHAQTQALGGIGAQGQQVHLTGQKQGEQDTHQNHRTGGQQLAHIQVGHAADAEIGIADQGVRVEGDHRVHPGAEHAGQRHARQHQGDAGSAGLFGQQQDEQHPHKGPEERGQRHRRQRAGGQRAAECHAQPRAGVDADGAGGGQGVGQHRLDNAAADRQRGPGQQAAHRAGQPHIGQDGRAVPLPPQALPQLHRGQGHRAQAQAQHGGQQHGQRHQAQPHRHLAALCVIRHTESPPVPGTPGPTGRWALRYRAAGPCSRPGPPSRQ